YNREKYDEAFKSFDASAKGKDGKYVKEQSTLDALFFMTACSYKTAKWQQTYDTSLKAVEMFKRERKAWDAVYNAAVNMLKAKKSQKTAADKEKLGELASVLFTKLAKEYSIHPSAPVAAWQVAEGYWADAVAAGKDKKKLQSEVASAKGAEAKNGAIKKLNAAIKKQRAVYEKALPAYKVMTEFYGNSKYGRLAFYKMAWIFYILEKKPEAVAMFKKFTEVQDDVEPGVYDTNYIQAKSLVADISFRQNDLDVAEKGFAEVLKITAKGAYTIPEDKTSAANAEKRILAARRSAMALTPWVDDKRGQDLLDKADALLEEVEILDGTVKQYEASIASAKDAALVELPPPAVIPADEKAPSKFEAGKMPADFAFKRFLERVPMLSNLVADLPKETQLRVKDGLLWGLIDNDLIGGIGGKGLSAKVRGKRVEWDSTLVACYRTGKLVGVFDPSTSSFRAAKGGEAPATIELALPVAKMPMAEAQIRLQFLKGVAVANRKEAENVETKGSTAQTKALTGLQTFLNDPANAR
ncbi:hypothetical protein BVY04_00455, partial [bacterium M21]